MPILAGPQLLVHKPKEVREMRAGRFRKAIAKNEESRHLLAVVVLALAALSCSVILLYVWLVNMHWLYRLTGLVVCFTIFFALAKTASRILHYGEGQSPAAGCVS